VSTFLDRSLLLDLLRPLVPEQARAGGGGSAGTDGSFINPSDDGGPGGKRYLVHNYRWRCVMVNG
jgi:hypothetical protein